jgi:Protein of unknown function (DUF2782)
MLRHLLLCVGLCAAFAMAQDTPKDLEPLPESPAVDDTDATADEPQVTIKQRGEDTVEEYRVNGRLYMIKVTPKHGVPYYLVDRRGGGQFTRMDTLDSGFTVPMWVILGF